MRGKMKYLCFSLTFFFSFFCSLQFIWYEYARESNICNPQTLRYCDDRVASPLFDDPIQETHIDVKSFSLKWKRKREKCVCIAFVVCLMFVHIWKIHRNTTKAEAEKKKMFFLHFYFQIPKWRQQTDTDFLAEIRTKTRVVVIVAKI